MLLSTPSRDGELFSPARLVVARYVKGTGLRVVAVDIAGSQIEPFFVHTGYLPDAPFLARPGQTVRVPWFHGRPTLGRGCEEHRIERARVLRAVSGSTGRGRARWSATRFAGPLGVRCGVCGNRRFFYGVRLDDGLFPRVTLVLGAAGPDVRTIDATSPAGSRRATLSRSGRSFIAALPGEIRSRDVTVTVTLRSGALRVYRGRRSVNLRPPPR